MLADYQTNAVLADRGYDANSLITYLHVHETEVVIPAKKNRLEPPSIDENLYKDCKIPGRRSGGALVNKLKQYCQVVTCYEKTAIRFAGFDYLASTLILLR